MANKLIFFLWAILVNTVSANPVSDNEEEAVPFNGGYTHYDKFGYYKLYRLKSTWGYAWKQCKEDGGHLLVIDSDEEKKIVQDMMKSSKKDIYIGVHDIFVEGWFFTVTDKSLLPSVYNKWRFGEPDNNNLEDNGDCVIFNKNGELQDEDCSAAYYFICEVESK